MARKCTVCSHSKRNEIDEMIVEGKSLRSLSKEYGLSTSALHRHSKGHLLKDIRQAYAIKEDFRIVGLMDRFGELKRQSSFQDVYFISDQQKETIKIGIAEDPIRRLKELQVGSAERLEILALIPRAGRKIEANLHSYFSHWRLSGEWFSSNSELTALIDWAQEAQREMFFATSEKARKGMTLTGE